MDLLLWSPAGLSASRRRSSVLSHVYRATLLPRLIDTIKLVAYRAETVLAMIVREKLTHADEARSLVRDLLRSDADLYPDEAAGLLEVRIHTLANPRSNRAIQHLLDHLNAAECAYPGTNLRLTYTLVFTPPE